MAQWGIGVMVTPHPQPTHSSSLSSPYTTERIISTGTSHGNHESRKKYDGVQVSSWQLTAKGSIAEVFIMSTPESPPSEKEIPWAWIKCVRDMCDPRHHFQSSQSDEDKILPVSILPWLYLGDRQSARRLAAGRGEQSLKVTHILALHPVAPYEEADMQERLKGSGICHKRILCDDTEGYDMVGKHWEECRDFLVDVRQQHYDFMQKNPNAKHPPCVLVHCVAGINRSGLISCAAQMVLERQFVVEVVQHCVTQRGSVLWNRSFQQQLCQLAQRENLLGPMPEGYDSSKPKCWDNFLPPPPAHNVVISKEEKRFRVAQLLSSRSRVPPTEQLETNATEPKTKPKVDS